MALFSRLFRPPSHARRIYGLYSSGCQYSSSATATNTTILNASSVIDRATANEAISNFIQSSTFHAFLQDIYTVPALQQTIRQCGVQVPGGSVKKSEMIGAFCDRYTALFGKDEPFVLLSLSMMQHSISHTLMRPDGVLFDWGILTLQDEDLTEETLTSKAAQAPSTPSLSYLASARILSDYLHKLLDALSNIKVILLVEQQRLWGPKGVIHAKVASASYEAQLIALLSQLPSFQDRRVILQSMDPMLMASHFRLPFGKPKRPEYVALLTQRLTGLHAPSNAAKSLGSMSKADVSVHLEDFEWSNQRQQRIASNIMLPQIRLGPMTPFALHAGMAGQRYLARDLNILAPSACQAITWLEWRQALYAEMDRCMAQFERDRLPPSSTDSAGLKEEAFRKAFALVHQLSNLSSS